ncbi:hypothetical protein SAMN04488107_1867 [Geodermatophilus saharensis]|uniref:Uncharacterized protein n=1 Tax=Geodermatophilus saharensis TaxID=1137994 RepID=A0A239CY84_9ACTN|nr:hypothetical protein [Geodermatophilus saharensis]SNS24524.1 hypothetical protein SAMN04488107_1867 [Geodermatophilus saharensis]
MVQLVAVLTGVVLTAAVLPRRDEPPGAGRLRRAVVRHWRAHVHLWDTVLARDAWGPSDGGARPLHWVGSALEGSVLPGPPR